jgi:nifR3 family TIM-barrel protein
MENTGIENILKSKGLFARLDNLAADYLKFAFGDNSGGNIYSGNTTSLSGSESFKIGNLKLDGALVAAPLAGISDNTFRIFSKAFSASLSFTEMISAYGIHFKNRETESLSYITGYERPCGIQLFGSEPDILLEAALAMQEKADIIDINMGCPVPKVLKTGSGGMLLTDEAKIAKIISAVVPNIKRPLTIKTRLGWDKNNINIERVAKIASENGASAIVIHARTVKQGFTGQADYSYIRKVKEKLDIPVIASGDIDTPAKAVEVINSTGCDAVMVGRALKGRQWILPGINAAINTLANKALAPLDTDMGQPYMYNLEPPVEFMKSFAGLYLKFMIEFKGEVKALHEFRKMLAWIFKGLRGISRHKNDFFSISTEEDAIRVIESINI